MIDLDIYKKEYTAMIENSQFTLCDPCKPEKGLPVELRPGRWFLTLDYVPDGELYQWKLDHIDGYTLSKVRQPKIPTKTGLLALVTPGFEWKDTALASGEWYDDVFSSGDCLIIDAGRRSTAEFIIDWSDQGLVSSILCKLG